MRTTLYRHYWWFSLLLMVAGGLVLGTTVLRIQLQQIEALAQDRNENLTQVVRSIHAADIDALVQSPVEGRSSAVIALQQKVSGLIRDSDIAKLKVYNLQGITVFSTDPGQIGENKSDNAGFQTARAGEAVSEMTHRDQFSAFEKSLSDVDLVASYIPVMAEGRVVAVFELYQNVSALTARIRQSVWRIGGILILVLGTLYALLLALVRRIETLEQAQKEQLAQANAELDQRVAQRTQELRLSEARMRSLMVMSSDFFWETDSQHRFTQRTVSAREGEGGLFNPADFIGKLRWEVPSSSPDAQGWAAHRAMLEAHQPFRDFEIGRTNAQGQESFVSVSGDPIFASDGSFRGYRGVGTDITERKRAETELQIAAAAFETQQSTVVTDAQAIILRVNPAFEADTGYTQDEVVGKTPAMLRSDRHEAGFYRALWNTVLATGQWQGEIWNRCKDGSVEPKWLTISAVRSRQGAITHFVATHFDLSERKAADQRITELAFYDTLTQLPNRTLFRDRLQMALAASHRSEGAVGALVFLDLDQFKSINDAAGHAVGDALLRHVAQSLRASVDEGVTVARLGGDEFALLLPGLATTLEAAVSRMESLGQRWLQAIATPVTLEGTEYATTASLGVTLWMGPDADSEELQKQAELAMYRSKERGRNCLRFFDAHMQTQAITAAALERDLRRGIGEQQLQLHFQALVAKDKSVAGAEVLVRWQHPQQGLLAPGAFIDMAERTGLIVPLGQWVLEAACQQLARWREHPSLRTLTLAVNVSAHQFHQADFADTVIATLERTGADPARLKLELTESVLVDRLDDVVRKMGTLRALGIQFALDDFGTGYSSLAYLSRLPLDQLKIDRSFVAAIETDDSAVAICAATIGLAHNLGLHVVAEGVETEAQRYFLGTVHRCDFLQGYLLARPVPLADFEALAMQPPRI